MCRQVPAQLHVATRRRNLYYAVLVQHHATFLACYFAGYVMVFPIHLYEQCKSLSVQGRARLLNCTWNLQYTGLAYPSFAIRVLACAFWTICPLSATCVIGIISRIENEKSQVTAPTFRNLTCIASLHRGLHEIPHLIQKL